MLVSLYAWNSPVRRGEFWLRPEGIGCAPRAAMVVLCGVKLTCEAAESVPVLIDQRSTPQEPVLAAETFVITSSSSSLESEHPGGTAQAKAAASARPATRRNQIGWALKLCIATSARGRNAESV